MRHWRKYISTHPPSANKKLIYSIHGIEMWPYSRKDSFIQLKTVQNIYRVCCFCQVPCCHNNKEIQLYCGLLLSLLIPDTSQPTPNKSHYQWHTFHYIFFSKQVIIYILDLHYKFRIVQPVLFHVCQINICIYRIYNMAYALSIFETIICIKFTWE